MSSGARNPRPRRRVPAALAALVAVLTTSVLLGGPAGAVTVVDPSTSDTPVVGVTPSPTPSPTPEPTGTPTPEPTGTGTPTPEPSSSPTPDPEPTAPAAPSVTAPPSPGTTTSPAWTVSAEAGAATDCTLTGPGGDPVSASCPGGYTADLAGRPDGTYTLTVVATRDGLSSTPATSSYELDRAAPDAPGIDGPRGLSSDPRPVWRVTGGGNDDTVECTLSGPSGSDLGACTRTLRPTLVDGEHVLSVLLRDRAGNAGAPAVLTYTLDSQAPQAPAVGGPDGPSRSLSPAWTWVTPEGTTSECALQRGTAPLTEYAACPTAPSIDAATADGEVSLHVRLRDAAGNASLPGTSPPYLLDRTAPEPPTVTGPVGPEPARSASVSFSSAAGETGAAATCRAVRAEVGAPSPDFVPCSSPWTAVLDADGTWRAEVRLTDAAGNTGPAGSSAAWVVDTLAPDAPTVSAPRSPGRDTDPTWSVSAEDGATLSCRLTAPAGTTPAWSPCPSPLTTPLTGPDGTYALEVRATDAAGGTSEPGRDVYVLDTTPPGTPVIAGPPSPSRERAPSFTFASAGSASASCRLTRGTTQVQDWAACTSPAVLDLTGLPDGAYTLAVRTTDEAGSTGPTATVVHVLDSTAPAPPVLTDLPASPNPGRAPRFSFTAEPDTTTTCRVRRADGTLVVDADCTSPVTVDLSGQPEGEYRVAVRAQDRAGNVSQPAVATYVLDATAPAAAVLTGPASPGRLRTPAWTVDAPGPAECRLTRGVTVVSDWAACSTRFTADLATAPDGTYVLSVRVRDAAGNVSATTTSRYVLDTAAAPPAVLTGPPSPSSARTPTWVVASAEAGVTAQCTVLAPQGVRQETAPCAVSVEGEPFAVDLAGALDGPYTLVVRLLDAAGNAGPEQRSVYVLDTVAPGAVTVGEPSSPSPDATPTWLLEGEPGTTFECRLSAAATVLQDWARCTSPFTVDLTGRAEAAYTVTVRALDAAGNAGPDHTSVYTLDRSAPLAPGAVVGPTGPSTDRAPRWTFVLEAGSTATCSAARGSTVLRTGPCTSPYTLDLAGAPDGSYTVTVRAVDRAGNAGPASVQRYVLDTSAPAAPRATLVPTGPSASTSPRFAWSVATGDTSACRTTLDGAVLLDWAACASPWTAALGTGAEGTYGLQVRATDRAGNASPTLALDYVLDRDAGLLAGFTATPAPVGTDRTPTWALQVERGQALQCRLTGPDAAGGWTPCGSARAGGAASLVDAGTYTAALGARPDGEYVLELRGVTAAGDAGPVTRSVYALLTSRPAAPALTGPAGDSGRDPSVSWSWEPADGTTTECRVLRDGTADGAWAPCEGPLVLDLEERGEGLYALELRARNEAGATGDVVRGSYRYDVTSPRAAAFVGRPVLATGGRSVFWAFTQPDDTDAFCTVTRAGQAVVAEQPCSRGFAVLVTGPGLYVLSVELRDRAGNAGPVARSAYLSAPPAVPPRVVDAAPPAPPPSPDSPGAAPDERPALPVVPVPPRQGPPLPGGPGAVVPVGPPLEQVAQQAPLEQAAVEGGGPVERAVDLVEDVLPDGLSLPSPGEVPGALGRVLQDTFGRAAEQPTLPLAVLLVVGGFLLVQNRIDRRDPKLASAPVEAEPELDFGPVLRTPAWGQEA